MRGHFILTSGRHSDVYFEKFRVLERPDVLSALCAEIAHHFSKTAQSPTPNLQSEIRNPQSPIDLVAGPTTGGIIIAFEVARQMALPAIYVESEDGVRKLRRNAAIKKGARVLVVDDVLTTGKSVFETMEVVRGAGGEVAGVAVLIDRTEKPLDFGCPFFASYRVGAQSYDPSEIPDSLKRIPAVKPGSSVQPASP